MKAIYDHMVISKDKRTITCYCGQRLVTGDDLVTLKWVHDHRLCNLLKTLRECNPDKVKFEIA